KSVLLGMVEAMVKKAERLALGQGLQNMRYSDVFDSFCSLLASHSPRAYKTFHHHFGGQDLRSKQPLFEPGFSEKNIARAAETIRRLKYDGPLALSWDDTDLEKALATWKDSD
ncbi:hypothetical protein BU15DRAFT_36788, partial [Melanogaster broomeanus]